ncbi:diguanylate cyclase [Parafrankia elaeagni]|uniref:diguanylate cyclase n=1 Tax=Parafrankia elaeagni TaxID=222534 RepID=UPI0003618E2E|nr:diguanylate cyclase [Parafrankia elaeagni]
MTPGRDPPAAPEAEAAAPLPDTPPEVLAETELTRVTRVLRPGGPVIRKEALGRGAELRLRHEREILRRLVGVEGAVQLAAGAEAFPASMLLVDIGGTALSRRATPLAPELLVTIAEALARAVAGVHDRGVVHRDICPSNIVVSTDGSRLCLIDFALATTHSSVRPEFTHHNAIVGTVPYLAPEQTGRTSRPSDHRADLYAVGATLYELATGAPPFGAQEPLRVIHDHLARVPVPVARRNPAVPPELSAIIAHLLEKEPDDRYQSAGGLLHDLALLRSGTPPEQPGNGDLRTRPLVSTLLFGREPEIDALGTAFTEATTGHTRGVLVSGPPGVGKTSLVDELRLITAGRDGWFVTGKFDQYRRDQAHDGLRQALRALGRLLLAEPEDRLGELRDRLRRVLGANAGLAAAAVPELALVLDVPPEPGDLMSGRARATQAAVESLRAVASPKRPVVCFVDDIQWATRAPLEPLDQIFTGAAEIDGLLLVSAFRDGVLDPAAPLAEVLDRWLRDPAAPRHLRLENLAPPAQAMMVADILHLARGPAADLARTIAPFTQGNPMDTVELLNTLRYEGLLSPAQDGWRWDRQVVRRRLDRDGLPAMLAAPVRALPGPAAELLAALACLAGQVDLDLLTAAMALPADEVERRLAPALDAGLLVIASASGGRHEVRFVHDRTRESVLAALTARPRRTARLRLRLARTLADHPEYCSAAAEQYLAVIDISTSGGSQAVPEDIASVGALADDERPRVAALLRRAADEARAVGSHAQVERLLTAAAELVDPADVDELLAVHTERHAALHNLGRLDEADAAYRTITRLCADPVRRTAATGAQISSLTFRGRATEAIQLGIDQIQRLGLRVPEHGDLAAEIDRGLDRLDQWINDTSDADDVRRPELTDQRQLSIATIIYRLMPAIFLHDQMMSAWLTVMTLEIWAWSGPSEVLLGPASHAAFVTTARRGDRRTGHQLVRRLLAVGHARGYEPAVWQALLVYTVSSGHWFEPLEENLAGARRALAGLLEVGDYQSASWAHHVVLFNLLDSAPSLDIVLAEAEAAVELTVRTGNQHAEELLLTYHHLLGVLRGEAEDTAADEAADLSLLAGNSSALAHFHLTRAFTAAVFDRPDDLSRHLTALEPLWPPMEATYPTLTAVLLRMLSSAWRIRSGQTEPSRAELAALDETITWLAARTADAPQNVLHLLSLAQAERAWAVGDFQQAAYLFDIAQREAVSRERPWHLALILEEAARFYLAHGMEEAGRLLLTASRRVYATWGATAKVNLLDWGSPVLRSTPGVEESFVQGLTDRPTRRSVLTSGAIDLRGIVAASRALSSETSVVGLQTRVVAILSEMTGATDVHLLLRDEEHETWTVSTGAGDGIPLREAGHRRLLPPSVVWYAERTREPVVVANAAADERFRRDPCFHGLDRCSLLAIPITTRGRLRAMLMLENRMIRHAFSADRLEGIMAVAGQLAVSLDNALMYASLERKVAERTRQLAAANRQLRRLSVTDPLTGLANRRRLDEILEAEWRQARRQPAPIALMMIDIDHFKLYNDYFGHIEGDRCLQRVAGALSRNLADRMVAARFGGEEFTVVLPGTDAAAAARLARHLRAIVEELGEAHPRAASGVVTVSIGVTAIVPGPDDTLADFMTCADVALYRAKRSGRNRVEVVLEQHAPG